MRLRFIVAAATLVSANLLAHAADITYSLNETVGSASAVGTLTTDGAIGTLTQADLVSYTITVSDSTMTDTYTEAGSHAQFAGTDLTATSSGLFFNFGDTAFGGLVLGDATNINQLCFFTQGTLCNGAAGSVQIRVDGSDFTAGVQNGVGQIGTAVSTTPEPSSIALLGTGLLGIAATIRRRLV